MRMIFVSDYLYDQRTPELELERVLCFVHLH